MAVACMIFKLILSSVRLFSSWPLIPAVWPELSARHSGRDKASRIPRRPRYLLPRKSKKIRGNKEKPSQPVHGNDGNRGIVDLHHLKHRLTVPV
ncbi:hypothetical protein F5X96DRAFT_643683 [Biscogniauxia mediterranea]|nr:hypothetical protein F5X96DRAFT_643683 [Biscogniauxia mediterranea]